MASQSTPTASTPPPPADSFSSQPLPVDSPPSSAAVKPLLNPLQTAGAPPASTMVEPPRSPNPLNPATDDRGANVDLEVPSTATSVVAPAEVAPADGEAPAVDSIIPTASPALEPEQPILSPLPPDAPMPLTPQPKDEPPPVLAPGMIPPAVSTPTVITTEEQEAKGEMLGTEPTEMASPADDVLPNSFPTPANTTFDPVASTQTPGPVDMELPAAPGGSEQIVDEPMDIDGVGEAGAIVEPSPLEPSASTSSLKRAGEELQGREDKRVREDATPAISSSSFLPPPSETPLVPAAPPIWLSYVAPPPRPAGPTTPLTAIQHKHLLASVRSLKKNKDAPVFLDPVDVVRFGIPHYPTVIPKPMDLGTVETKLIVSDPRGAPKDKSKMNKWDMSKGSYRSVSEVVEDVRQIWENTYKFNGPEHIVSSGAARLAEVFEKMLSNMPSEPAPPPIPVQSPAAGPSTTPTAAARRPSVSQPPTIRRTSDGTDTRPKREIHPPPSKDLAYAEGLPRKPKRRNDPQLQWANRTLKGLETTQKYYSAVAPFLYPVKEIIDALPDYATLIKKPIDLIIIKQRLNDGDYDDISQVTADVKLMASNAMKYNPPAHAAHQAAQQFLQFWDEKLKECPPKQEIRDASEDPLGEDFGEDSSNEDSTKIWNLERQIADAQQQIDDLRAKKARKMAAKTKKLKPAKVSTSRKQSMPKASPGLNGNGNQKKPRKSKDMYREDDDGLESEEDRTILSLTQKQELAEKIQVADGDTLTKAIEIIQQTTTLGSNNEEIELDIDSLPPRTVYKLYILVCRGGRKVPRAKGGAAVDRAKKPARKGTGGVPKKHMNEQEEADRIKRMEAQLQSFEPGRTATYEGDESDSSEEESSDEE